MATRIEGFDLEEKDLKNGKFYVAKWPQMKTKGDGIIFRYDGELGVVSTHIIDYPRKTYSCKNSNLSGRIDNQYKEATKEEQEWLQTCIDLGRFISWSEIKETKVNDNYSIF